MWEEEGVYLPVGPLLKQSAMQVWEMVTAFAAAVCEENF